MTLRTLSYLGVCHVGRKEMLTSKSLQARLSSLQQSNIALSWRATPLQDRLVRLVRAAYLKPHKSSVSCKAIGMANLSLQTSTRTTAEAAKMSIRSWVLSTRLTRLLHAMTAPSSVRLPQPIISLFKQIKSTKTMSRCSRAPPKMIMLT